VPRCVINLSFLQSQGRPNLLDLTGLTGENLKVVLAKFSTLSWAVLLHNNINVPQAHSHF
jgi:hypothetical protein